MSENISHFLPKGKSQSKAQLVPEAKPPAEPLKHKHKLGGPKIALRGGGVGVARAPSEGGGGGLVGKMGFRAGTLCYVVLAVLVQILPATKSVVGWHDTPADG